jgi:hypothetical protein
MNDQTGEIGIGGRSFGSEMSSRRRERRKLEADESRLIGIIFIVRREPYFPPALSQRVLGVGHPLCRSVHRPRVFFAERDESSK